MNEVQAQRVKAVRPRVCSVCRRTINAGDTYEKYTVTDEYGAVLRIKSCLKHENDEETDTMTRAMHRIKVGELREMYPPNDGTGYNGFDRMKDDEIAAANAPAFERDAKARIPDPEQRVEPRKHQEMTPGERVNKEVGDLAFDLWSLSPTGSHPLSDWAQLAIALHAAGWRKTGE